MEEKNLMCILWFEDDIRNNRDPFYYGPFNWEEAFNFVNQYEDADYARVRIVPLISPTR